ncbi:MAG: MATE family efflux transporter [Proteobacteria bacterium]|nr:MATE family efflux transporter [Pseudomonadota bacterium]MDA1301944.1 MATE family efflux transporter [Pseudomonadota bacterium]
MATAVTIFVQRDRALRVFAIGAPIVGGMVSGVLLGLVDTAMVGVLGTTELAAVGFSSFLSMVFFSLAYGVSIAIQALVSRRKGEERPLECGTYLIGASWLTLLVGPALSALLYFSVPWFYPLLNPDPAVVSVGIDYVRWLILQITLVGLIQAHTGFWNGLGLSRLYIPMLLVMHTANILFNYLFIFGNLGAPEMGAEGAGFATFLASLLGVMLYLFLAIRHGKPYGVTRRGPSRADMGSIIRLAIPAGLQQLLDLTALFTTYAIVGLIGTMELACYSVLINLINLVGLPAWGLGTAGATLVGQALGEKNIPDAAAWAWDVIKIGTLAMALIGLPFLLVPDLILQIWIHDPATLELARVPTRILGFMIAINGIGYMFAMMLNGAGDIRRVTWINLLTQWLILVPGAYFFGVVLEAGLIGIWLTHQFAYRAGQSLIFAGIWRSGRWSRVIL